MLLVDQWFIKQRVHNAKCASTFGIIGQWGPTNPPTL